MLSKLLCFALLCASVLAVPANSWKHTNMFTPTNYSVVPNIFIQDSTTFISTGYNVLNDSFGLIDKSPNRWRNLTEYIHNLNKYADSQTAYKLIYLARHAQGFHNLAETTYGTPAWNCYWALQNGDGVLQWGPDSKLTPSGISVAQSVNAAWKEQILDGVPLPQTLLSSPLSRAASTLNITWKDILIDPKKMKPKFLENLRESIGLHTCDARSNKGYLESTYPDFEFEVPFSYHDEFWGPTYEEQSGQQALRTQQVLNQIFATNPNTYISITAHGGTISGFFTAVNHLPFGVQPGGFVPILVKAVGYNEATNKLIVGAQSGTAPVCTANPTISVSAPATATVPATVVTPTTTSATK